MKNLLMWLLMGINAIGYSQTLTIKDNETGSPVEMAIVKSDQPKALEVTNVKGQVNIAKFKEAIIIEIVALGYKPQIKSYNELEAAGFAINLVPSVINLDELVVSATRWNQEAKDVPSKITSITAKEVAFQNPQTAADLLGTSGEVFIQKSQQGGGSPMIRGFSANRLLYTVDGVRMNNAIFRGGNLQNVISLDPFAIENTEVFFGPGSIIYGSDAIGGVMAFRTLTPGFTVDSIKPLIKGKAAIRYSTANHEKTGHFHANIGFKKFSIVTSITGSGYEDLKMGKHGPDEYLRPYYVEQVNGEDVIVANKNPRIQRPSGYSQLNVMQKLRFKPNEDWDLQYGFHYSETSEFARYDRLIETSNSGVPRSAVWKYGPQKWMMNLLTVTNTKSNFFFDNTSLRLAHQNFEESRIDRNYSGSSRFRLRTQKEGVQAYSANIDFEKKINKHVIFYGSEAVLNHINSEAEAVNIQTGEPIPVPSRYPNSTWKSLAPYINYQFRVSEKFMTQAGFRYNFYSINSDFTNHVSYFPLSFTNLQLNKDALTASTGFVFTPDETWRISFNASSGFRAPNVDDIGKLFDFTATEVVVPNTDLRAEYAYNAEMNFAKVFGQFLKVDLTGYYTQLDNALVRREFKVNGQDSIQYNGEMKKTYSIQNAAFANVYGSHIGFEIKLTKGLDLSTHFNYQKGVEEMNDGRISRSRHAAPPYGLTRLTYSIKKLRLQLYSMYSAQVSNKNLNEEEKQKPAIYAKDENGNPYSPSWYTLNLKSSYTFNTNFSLSAGVENITDQRYRPYSSGLVAPGRNFIISLRVGF